VKKPTPKQGTQKDETGKSTGSKTNTQTVNKVLDIGKGIVSVCSGVIDLGKEKEKTNQVRIKADADIETARQITERHRLSANVAHDEIARLREKDDKIFQAEMARLAIERDHKASQNHVRESLVQRLVQDSEVSKAQIVDTYQALLSDDQKK